VRVEGENVILKASPAALVNKKLPLPAYKPGKDDRVFVILGAGTEFRSILFF
jgi:hypothetical protein